MKITNRLRFAVALAAAAVPAVAATPAQAQTAADSAAIRTAALDYIEGWYDGDAARMERSLHPARWPSGSWRTPAMDAPVHCGR